MKSNSYSLCSKQIPYNNNCVCDSKRCSHVQYTNLQQLSMKLYCTQNYIASCNQLCST